MEDACRLSSSSGPVISIEIKPKSGVLSGSDSFCRYCMHQKLKLKEGKIERRSRYCPMDLFSGDPFAMQQALRSLAENPQNNLKMFFNGKPRFTEKTKSKDWSFLLECPFLVGKTSVERLDDLFSKAAQVR